MPGHAVADPRTELTAEERALLEAGGADLRPLLPPGGPPQTLSEEVWFSAGRQRNAFSGGPFPHGFVSDGTQAWSYAIVGGRTHVARSAGLPGGTTPLAPQEASIGETLAQLVRDTHNGCAAARVEGREATVAGRAAYVVAVVPSSTPCASPAKGAPERLTVWIDEQTYLPLRSEEVNAKATVRYEVTGVEYDVAIPDATFQYTPPAGEEVLPDIRDLKAAIARDLRPADARGAPAPPANAKP